MFGFYRRTKVETWEIEFLKKVLTKLDEGYSKFVSQVESGLIKGVTIGLSDIPNYVGFKYDSSVYKKFYDSKGRNYKVTDLRLSEIYSKEPLSFSIYFAYGIINGYSSNKKLPKNGINPSSIDTRFAKKVYIGEYNSEILSLLNFEERK